MEEKLLIPMDVQLDEALDAIRKAKRQQFLDFANFENVEAGDPAAAIQKASEMETLLRKEDPFQHDADLAAALAQIRAAKCRLLVAYAKTLDKPNRASAAAINTAMEMETHTINARKTLPTIVAAEQAGNRIGGVLMFGLLTLVFVVISL